MLFVVMCLFLQFREFTHTAKREILAHILVPPREVVPTWEILAKVLVPTWEERPPVVEHVLVPS